VSLVSKMVSRVLGGVLFGSFVAGCSDDVVVLQPPATAEPGGSDEGEESPSNPALLVSVYVVGVDGDRSIYVGAVPKVPEGELDYSDFLEFGNVDVSTNGGYVFVWERDPALMQRYAVNEDLSLTAGPRLSFANYGLGGGGELVYVSPTRAYMLSPQLDTVVVWDPSSMVITGTIPVELPERLTQDGFEPFAHKPQLVGDLVVWQLVVGNFATSQVYPGVVLAVANANDEEPVRFVEDERCIGADGGYVDEHGDYYVRAGGYWGYYVAYGSNPASTRTCILRLRAGEDQFDADYLVDLRELTGSYVNFPWFHVQGSQYIAPVWPGAQDIPEVVDDYWFSRDLQPLLVDIESGAVTPYPALEGAVVNSSAEYRVDGVSYYEWATEALGGEGNANISELRPTGLVPRFSLPSLWAFARIR
jgi:hypothetical protein